MAGAVIAACQPLPQPFAPADKFANRLLAPGLRTGTATDGITGIHVRPIEGAPKPVDAALARAMAKALRDLDVAAGTRARNRDSLFLVGRAENTVRDAERLDIRISWRLSDSQGRIIGRHQQRKTVRRDAWFGGAGPLLSTIASGAAWKISRFIGDATTAMALPRPPIAIPPVDGAPGDGAKSLARAMTRELARAGIKISADAGDQGLMLLGDVRIGEGGATQRIDITWTLIRGDGSRIGTVSQGTEIKAGSLDGPWGATATAIARDAASGVVDLLDRMAAKNLAQRR
ncbi:MAG: hypothetical protein V3T02_09110 [Alphaproteobacteria bacterium]